MKRPSLFPRPALSCRWPSGGRGAVISCRLRPAPRQNLRERPARRPSPCDRLRSAQSLAMELRRAAGAAGRVGAEGVRRAVGVAGAERADAGATSRRGGAIAWCRTVKDDGAAAAGGAAVVARRRAASGDPGEPGAAAAAAVAAAGAGAAVAGTAARLARGATGAAGRRPGCPPPPPLDRRRRRGAGARCGAAAWKLPVSVPGCRAFVAHLSASCLVPSRGTVAPVRGSASPPPGGRAVATSPI